MTLPPSFHCPRFLSSSTRSKRFRTLRFAAMVLAPLRLRCCDIGFGPSKIEPGKLRHRQNFSNRDRLQLVGQHNIGAACRDLVKNVEAFGDQLLPMRQTGFLDDEKNGIGRVPALENRLLARLQLKRAQALRERIGGLVHEEKLAVEIKEQAASGVERSLIINISVFARVSVQISGCIGQGKKW